MKIQIEKSDERGYAKYPWLETRHSFSFSNYYNPERMNFGKLRVFNDDIIEGGKGFGMHQHDNMEIVTIVLEGALEHRDSMGNHGIIKEWETQRITAGTGIAHSEFNHNSDKKAHILQIWIDTAKKDLKPEYEQKKIEPVPNKLSEIVSNKKGKNIFINQDARFLLGDYEKGKTAKIGVGKGKGAYVFVISGKIKIGKDALGKADAAGVTETSGFEITPTEKSKFLVIEVPMG